MTARTTRKITPRVLARWLGISPHTVMKWVHSGELPALNISIGPVARFVIYRKDVVTFLRKQGTLTPDQLASLGLENGASPQK